MNNKEIIELDTQIIKLIDKLTDIYSKDINPSMRESISDCVCNLTKLIEKLSEGIKND